MATPEIIAFFDEATFTASYLIVDPASGQAAILDSVLDFDAKSGRSSTASADRLLEAVAARGLHVVLILETHVHADHLTAAAYLKRRTGAPVVIGEGVRQVQATFAPIFAASDVKGDGAPFDRLVKDGDRLDLGALSIEVLATPGHTPACVSYKIGDHVFVGDTLFMPDFGTARCDFPGGDAAQLYRSIHRVLALPDQTTLWMCHDYKAPGRAVFAWKTTVGEQRAHNPHVRDGIDEAAFVAMRQARDAGLAMPTLILPSVQVNMRAGHFPPPNGDGHVYLKLPVDRL